MFGLPLAFTLQKFVELQTDRNHRLKRLYSVYPMDLFSYLGQRLIVSGTHTFYECDLPLYPEQIPFIFIGIYRKRLPDIIHPACQLVAVSYSLVQISSPLCVLSLFRDIYAVGIIQIVQQIL